MQLKSVGRIYIYNQQKVRRCEFNEININVSKDHIDQIQNLLSNDHIDQIQNLLIIRIVKRSLILGILALELITLRFKRKH